MAERSRAALAAGILLAGFLAGPAEAEPAIDCAKASTTPEIAFCADKDFQAADAALNAAYKAMMARIDAATSEDDNTARTQRRSWREAVTEAQRKWIAFRDTDCAAVGAAWMGGTGMGAAVSTCLAETTRARTAELKKRVRDGN